MTEQKISGRRSALRPVPPPAEEPAGPYAGRRYAVGMRYGATPELVEPTGPQPSAAPVPAPVAAALAPAPAPVSAAVGDLRGDRRPVFLEDRAPAAAGERPRRRAVVGHSLAAVAAVSGLALAAVYPDSAAVPAPDERVAHAGSAVSDVSVPGNDDYEIVRTKLTSSFSKDDQLDYLMSASGGDVTAVETGGILAQPLDQVRITSRFGTRVNPVTGYGLVNHIGQDYGIQCGTPVKASAAGTVVQAGWAGHSGNRVRIDHGNGLETTYNHNTSLRVAVGQKVERGEVVSLSGTTGNSTGCHLHFEVLVDGTAVDPAGWL
ncbi:peptidoglycan DD-metalloendopeptidase family protein [Zafaria sp. Z1313]|uniref:M23 family metallopeptidase n=1 Tax=unclassified Zafaria TaxID=2828765 RepID=UPI002E79BEC1|nr:M23 family metallopeptidase [Zafaria sp. J156]MEE1622257.1 M23 family metallopeptidase [Zafaria sp. J156]